MKTEMKTGARRKFLKTMKVLHETTRAGAGGQACTSSLVILYTRPLDP